MQPVNDLVLILTHTADHYTVDRVAAALATRGVRSFRFDTDSFPLEARASIHIDSSRPDSSGPAELLTHKGVTIRSDEVRAVWARKLWAPSFDQALDPEFRAMCSAESAAMLQGFFAGLNHARWVNDPASDYKAEIKMRQLRTAIEAGLRVPKTLNTNDPEQARVFYREVGGAMVAKLLKPLSTSMGAAPVFMYTSEVAEEDLADAEMLRHSPMVFQERIDKASELRIAYVAGSLFVGAIDAARSARGQVDWRLADPSECVWQEQEVPDDIASRLRDFMARLGLIYGAIDMIRTPEGEYVFLEVNPAGEWGMLEKNLGLPISEAIAEALVSK
ncbi:MAG: MvdC family ATP-grasp ribosomal peptide maturase [Blastocatellia bacterium AA13]|nr:MAG: MvdC family ATP-grasp ribosomal peptide maturase [Blastocatellia bacterium AA13]